MSDAEMRELEKLARAGDNSAFKKWQHLRARIGFTSDDAEYLQKYYELCEKFQSREISLFKAEGIADYYDRPEDDYDVINNPEQYSPEDLAEIKAELEERRAQRSQGLLPALNEEYKFLVHPKTLKTRILGRLLGKGYDNLGWAASNICY